MWRQGEVFPLIASDDFPPYLLAVIFIKEREITMKISSRVLIGTFAFLFSLCAVCTGKTILVNVAGGADFTSIQAAIADAGTVTGDEIEVAPGTYNEAIDFLGKAVRLYSSGGAEVTTINGTGYYHVVQCVSGEDSNTILEGFTVTGGNANSGYYSTNCGGGMFNYYTSPTVTNCIFSGNSADAGGGMYNEYGSPTVTDCTFTGNSAYYYGGGIENLNSTPIVTNCTFSGNSALYNGGGIYNVYSSPTVTNCVFSANSASIGGGMCNLDLALIVSNCIFSDNSAIDYGGGMFNGNSSSILVNCVFRGNSAAEGGGGMLNNSSSPKVTNCTFVYNSAVNNSGGIYNSLSSPIVTNCIIWANTNSQITNYDSSYPAITYCDIQDGYSGTGNINTAPLFIDLDGLDDIPGTADDNFRLSTGSPCIDAGDNLGVPPGIVSDADGYSRLIDGDLNISVIVDMGAYEFQCNWSEGDINCDGAVNLQDLMILSFNWLKGTEP